MALDYRRMMQENLDGRLDTERLEQLAQHLEADQQAAEEHAQLESLHVRLSAAPHVRAPERLAATIMARLAQSIEAQAQLQDLPEHLKQALMLSFSVVTVSMMPSMMAASYLVLNAQHDPAILNRVTERTVALMLLMIDAMVLLLEEIERLMDDDPSMAPIAVALIPVALLGMLEYIENESDALQNIA